MAFRLKSLRPLLLAAFLLAALVVAPVAAHAADTLTWQRTFAGPADIPNPGFDPIPVAGAFNAVSFASASNGWAVGVRVDNASQTPGPKGSFLAYTANGGASWTTATTGFDVELNAVDAVSATDVWAVGDAGTILHYNGGSWTSRTVDGWPSGKSFEGVAFFDSDHGWAVGEGRGVVYTSDGGDTWTVISAPTGTVAFHCVAAKSAVSALAVGDLGSMRVLTDTSATDRASSTGMDLYGITFADANHVWAVGEYDTIVKSSDGGSTWGTAGHAIPQGISPSALTMRSIAFAGPYDGIVVSTLQEVWHTSNGGLSWSLEHLHDDTTLDDYDFRCVAFAGTVSAPVIVGRSSYEQLTSSDNEARAYLGAWTDLTLPPPFAPTNLIVGDGGAPRPRISLTWTDNSGDEEGYVVQRAQDGGAFSTVATLSANATSYTDSDVGWVSSYAYQVRAFRGHLPSPWLTSAGYSVDAVAPTTTSDALGSYVSSADFTFSADDNAGGSGVAHTYSTIDNADQLDGLTRSVTDFGSHTLRFWSVDAAGNVEAQHVVAFTVTDPNAPDLTAPVTASNRVPYYANSATIQLSATDEAGGSGVAHTYCCVDGGAWSATSTAKVTGARAHTLAFYSVDFAGNHEATKTVTFLIITAPATNGTPSKPTVPASVRHGVSFTTYGYLIWHTPGTRPVTLYFYKRTSGRWVYRKSATASASNMLTFSKYSRSTTVPSAGTWRVRAGHKVGTLTRYSAWTTFTVH